MTGYSSYQDWLKVVDFSFPHLLQYIEQHKLQTLVIGASLLDLFELEGWNFQITRKTADLDISIQANLECSEYLNCRSFLLERGYKQTEPDKEFRLYPPEQKIAAYSYLDLLAHPGPNASENRVREVMGVGSNWAFDTISFGLHHAIPITEQISIPNLFGFLLMKFTSWESDPYRRAKDLGDIVDVVYGIVSAGQHYELSGPWSKIMHNQLKAENLLIKYLSRSAKPDDITINFEDFETELVQRGYRKGQLEEEIPRYFEEFLGAVISKN